MENNRSDKPSELLEKMVAWEAACKYCGDRGLVKMHRSQTKPYDLIPQHCYCYLCGQYYHMEIKDLKAFEDEQWSQKAKREECL